MGTAVGDRPHFMKPFLGPADTTLLFETFARCDRDRAGHRVAGQACELAGELAGFVVLDVESHGSQKVDDQAIIYPNVLVSLGR